MCEILFQMNTCSIHLGSGALLLDMSSLHCVQSKAFQRSSQSTTLSQGNIERKNNNEHVLNHS